MKIGTLFLCACGVLPLCFLFFVMAFLSGSCPSLDKTFEDVPSWRLRLDCLCIMQRAFGSWVVQGAFSLSRPRSPRLSLLPVPRQRQKSQVDKVNYSPQSRVLLGYKPVLR